MHITYRYLALLLLCVATQAWSRQPPIKVACIGNSVTFGYGLQEVAGTYPMQLQDLLGDAYAVGNFGHSGATLLRNGHNPYYKTAAFADALAFVPDIAVIHLGLNDTDPRNWPEYRDEFAADYGWLLDTLRAVNPEIKLYLCRLTPIFSGHPRFKSSTREWYWQIQHLLPQIAAHHGAALIDLHAPLYHRPDLFADNLHPDATGAGIIAQTVYSKITGNFGGLQLAPIFADHGVLQRDQPIRIHGQANAHSAIEVDFAGETRHAQTNSDGQWEVKFEPKPAGGPYVLAIRGGGKSIERRDMLVGDVWLCSGQSNMAFPLRAAIGGDSLAAAAADYPNLRLAHFQPVAATDPRAWDADVLQQVNELAYFSGSWQRATPENARAFSAIAYAFGAQIQQEEGVPIGLIQVAVGGSGIESWIDRYTLEHDPLLVDMLSGWRTSDFIMQWSRERAAVNLKQATLVKQRHPYEPAYNFEAGLAPLGGLGLKGVLWYQGESNAQNPELYEAMFAKLVSSWRQRWGQDLPFYYVQLSSIDRPSWPRFRDMQRQLQGRIPHVWMAVSSDLGDSLDVHPPHKLPIARRLADLALQHSYQRDMQAGSPELVRIQQQEGEWMLEFGNAEALRLAGQGPLHGFEFVTASGIAVPVQGRIVENTVILPMPEGIEASALRYAWQPFTRANLVNERGAPVSTFFQPLNSELCIRKKN